MICVFIFSFKEIYPYLMCLMLKRHLKEVKQIGMVVWHLKVDISLKNKVLMVIIHISILSAPSDAYWSNWDLEAFAC